jgi:hypothetical protein
VAKENTPRTAVAPDGGIYRINRRPAIEFTFEEHKNTPISRWMALWGKEFFSLPPLGTVEEILKLASEVNPVICKDGIIELPMIKSSTRAEEFTKVLNDLINDPRHIKPIESWPSIEAIPLKFPSDWSVKPAVFSYKLKE